MMSIVGFLLTIGVLVVVHEFGHYIVARLCKVKVSSFSVGFGPKLFKWQGKHNEWCISLIPLGGYVKMLDERESEVPEDLKHLAFNNKPAIQKILIAFAGPFFNILFAFFAYYALSMYGVYGLKPIIASQHATPLIKNLDKFPTPSQIVAIDGIKINSWTDAEKTFQKEARDKNIINLTLISNNQQQNFDLDITKYKANNDDISLSQIGLYPIKYLTSISYIEPQSVADMAGLKAQDKIISINNESINSWFQVASYIKHNPSRVLTFDIQRDNQNKTINAIPTSTTDDNGQIIGKIGIMPNFDASLIQQNSYIQKYSPITGITYAVNQCINTISANISMIKNIVSGKVSWHNVGGPVSIAQASGYALHQGIKTFIDLLALISISLAIMNLLPIPVLDGGHILIYTIEIIIGKQIGIKTQQMIFSIGMMIVLSISMMAIYNDILKIFN
ncbi:MAG: RIP metalloprotease RseP [Burkholderiales bacterium]|nr:RIP metalloprotease RseP [Burkholderiales bacterium]